MMRSYHFPSQDELRAVMQNQGLSLDMVRRQWERNFMAMEYLRSRIKPYVDEISPKQVLDYYTKHPEEFQRADSVQWQDLFVAAEKHSSREEAHRYAETLAERVRQGEDFAKLAQDKDDGYSGVRKGEGIGAKRGEIKPPEVETTLFQLHDGELSVVEMETGFHVVRLVKREHAGLAPFDEKTQKQIKEKLTNEVAQLEMKRIVNKLKHEAVIEYARGK
jgi:parvulin-like peptidyl-prolyl isomerase